MTPLTTEQKAELEKKIRDSIPNDESRELKAGCRIAWQYTHHLNTKSRKEIVKHGTVVAHYSKPLQYKISSESYVSVVFDYNKTTSRLRTCDIKILGRPLTLQDVLIALPPSEFIQYWVQGNQFVFAEQGEEETYSYDLTKPYHEQSEELFVFLHSLLCND